jgi:predicted protein tyrosine phosphatase
VTLYICSLAAVPHVAVQSRASHMITVISAGSAVERPASIAEENHLYLEFNDITAPAQGLVAPSLGDVEKILAFGRSWDRRAPMIVHCWAGVSRSTAAAYVLSHALCAGSDPQALAQLLRARAPWATPNSRLVAFADELLGAGGAMTRAITSIGRGQMTYEGRPFTLPSGAPDGSSAHP